MVRTNNAVVKRTAGNTCAVLLRRESNRTSILHGEAANHRIGLSIIPTRIHAPIRHRRISTVDDRTLRAVHRLDGDRLVVRLDRRVRAVRHDDRHAVNRLVDRVLDRLERLIRGDALVRRRYCRAARAARV